MLVISRTGIISDKYKKGDKRNDWGLQTSDQEVTATGSNPQPLSSSTNTQPLSQTGQFG